ncbi:MAG: SIS domain-containing protein [Elusimicrobiaceae bacterium]|nr:SIS domain-containing protein [Elusimicrobiaceae bacterium]
MKNHFNTPYFNEIFHLLSRLEQTQQTAMNEAAARIAVCLKNDGIIHTFGCGHSGSAALEPFHRSGCFAAVNAILDPGLMFQRGAQAGTDLERQEGYTSKLLATHDMRKGDVLFVFSNSGRNPAGIDAVLTAKQKGVFTVAFTAAAAHQQSKSRHSSGLLLKDVADLVIDNCVGQNETCLQIGDYDVAPVSTIAFAAVLHHILYQAAVLLDKQGVSLPVYKSSNAAGGDAHNRALEEKYAARIKHLK